eukprot:SAG11_NODE_1477_length_4837_cov_2.462431_4_plen_227_part_00
MAVNGTTLPWAADCGINLPPTNMPLARSRCGDDGSHFCLHGGNCLSVPEQTCTSNGDPHYRSFDGARFDFMGYDTFYWVVRSHNIKVQTFQGLCNGGEAAWPIACNREVAAEVDFGNGVVVRHTTLDEGGDHSFQITDENGRFSVRVEAQSAARSITVRVPGAMYRTFSAALCGNFDGNANNDVEGSTDAAWRNGGDSEGANPPAGSYEGRACISGSADCLPAAHL